MNVMGYERTKVAPWERYTDGEWHTVRSGPEDEPRADSMRAFSRHRDSVRGWAARNGYKHQLSRRSNGRIIRVRLQRPAGSARNTDPATGLMEALQLIQYALHLRQFGENAPGGTETWAQFDHRAELFLRRLNNTETSMEISYGLGCPECPRWLETSEEDPDATLSELLRHIEMRHTVDRKQAMSLLAGAIPLTEAQTESRPVGSKIGGW